MKMTAKHLMDRDGEVFVDAEGRFHDPSMMQGLATKADTIFQLASQLQRQADGYRELCGEILATLVVNTERGAIRPQEQDHAARWQEMLDRWMEQQRNLLGETQ